MTTKKEILAKTQPPKDTGEIEGIEVSIRGITTDEGMQEKGLKERYYEILSACILEPKFKEDELRAFKHGSLNSVWAKILEISTPDEDEIKN